MRKQVFRGYCPACANYAPMNRFITAHYFCRSCLSKIKQGLRKAHIDWTKQNPDKPMIEQVVNQVVEQIQGEEGKQKTTEKEWKLHMKEWRTLRGRRYRPKHVS